MIWKRRKIFQYEITDYFEAPHIKIFYMFKHKDRYTINKIFGRIFFKKYRKRSKSFHIPKGQTKLDQFFSKSFKSNTKEFRLPFKQKVLFPEIPKPISKSTEYIAIQNYLRFKGYLTHIFQLNSMEYWDELELNNKFKKIFNKISIKKFFQMEICRYKIGIDKIWKWTDYLKFNRQLLEILDILKEDILSINQYSIMLRSLGSEMVFNYFYKLVKECIKYKLIDRKILIWDGRFLESFCSKNINKKLGKYSDTEAGKYKHIGKYFGVGYNDSTLMCAKYNLTVYYDIYPANKNDNIVFRNTITNYYKLFNDYATKILIVDAGPYSRKSLELVKSYKDVPLILAKKNIKKDVIKVGKRKYINIKYVPENYIPHLNRILNLRTKIECQFSAPKVCYALNRMFNRGIENAKIATGKLKCTELLTALTALKLNRLDLVNSPSAFRDFKYNY
ncbi:MAG: hypothetical protein ACTSPY_17140 [Candidatus Helarchaeota archaeon]